MEKTGGGKKKRRRRKKKGEKSASSKEEEEEKIQSLFKKLGPPLLCLEGVAHFCFPFLFFVPLGDIKRWSGTDGPSLVFLLSESHWNYQRRGTGASSTRVFGIHAVRNFYCL